jgi:hypothetical protein
MTSEKDVSMDFLFEILFIELELKYLVHESDV